MEGRKNNEMLLSLSGSVAGDRSGLIKLTAMSFSSHIKVIWISQWIKQNIFNSTNTTFTHSRWITSLQFTLFLFQNLKPSILRGLEDIIHQRKFGTKNVSQLWLWLVSEWSRDSVMSDVSCVMCHEPVWPPVIVSTIWPLSSRHNVYRISKV